MPLLTLLFSLFVNTCFHRTLYTTIRFDWYLEKFVLHEYLKEKPEPTSTQDEQKESSDEHTDKQAKDKSGKKNTHAQTA